MLGLGLAATVVPVALMIAFIKFMGYDVVKTANTEFRTAALDAARQATVDIRQMCDVIDSADDISSSAAQISLFDAIASLGDISLSKTPSDFSVYDANVLNSKRNLYAPLIKFGDITVSPNSSDAGAQKLNALISSLKERLHCEISIFSKIPDSDLLVRVASTVTDASGVSIVGSYVSVKAGGDINSAISDALLMGRPTSGLTTIAGVPYSAYYVPLTDSSDNVVGIAFFGFPMPSVAELEKYLQVFPVGETGSVWVVDDSIRSNPSIRIARDTAATGLVVNDDPVEGRRIFLQQVIEKARSLRQGDVGVEVIKIPSQRRGADAVRLVTYTYYKSWNWIIGTTIDADEFSGSEAALVGRIDAFSQKIIYVGFIFGFFAIGVSLILASQMSKPLRVLARVARFHSRGDMAGAENELAAYSDKGGALISEFDDLAHSISDMTLSLSGLVSDIRSNGEAIAARADAISEIASSLESIAANEVASMRRVAYSGKSISLAADAVNKAASASAAQVAKTLSTSRECGDNLLLLKRNYDALYEASENIMQRLAVINGNAEKITEVVTAISEVNKQTNLLSLNASVEAERAGEVGLGFAVVARQIRRLADKTSAAGVDIERAVKQMQSAVNSGVMEMDRFGASVRQSLKIILETADSLTRVVGDIEGIGPKFENIAVRISALSESARGISDRMTSLSSTSVRARDGVVQFRTATGTLETTSASVLAEVSRFKTAEREVLK